MPNIDVTELFTDPDFATTFDVFQREAKTGSNGRVAISEVPHLDVQGVIAPASARTLRGNPDLTQTVGVIECWTQFRLEPPVDGKVSDRIAWKGNYYAVQIVSDWAEWGSGWRHAIAVRTGPIARGD